MIVNNPNELKPTSETISLATELSLEEVNKKISSMIGDHHLRKADVTGYLFLASSSSKQIDDGINVLKKTKCQNIKLAEIADEINEKKYILFYYDILIILHIDFFVHSANRVKFSECISKELCSY